MGKIISHYRILERLDEGGMGVVELSSGGGEKEQRGIPCIENLCLLLSY